jgi:magnesium transporter
MRSQSDVLCRLAGKKHQLVDREIEAFIRDTYDHTLRTLDRIDNLLEINMGSLNIYSSSFSNRMNETMRFLAVISTIGVPLTVLVGWYGMNFNAMPEVYWTYGYLMVILLAVTMITATFLFFRRKRWL